MNELQILINQCAVNNRRSQEKLYLMFYPELYALTRRFFADSHEALEALNDGMLKVYKSIGSFDGSKGSFFNWMYTIIRNTALDKLKIKKQPGTGELNELILNTADNNPLQGLEWKDIYAMLDVLGSTARVVCTLFYLEGFTIKEIGESLSLSEGTIKWHLSEIRRKLKPVLKSYCS
ncbi:MAG TPA: sigma-70 family RNA polymerase sigma factor [Chitinophagaceae bacterium]|nr:sigma-70 family RNA polymerase sigma factor [Chitinophagaceae bacterium]